ncbi:TIGR02646 family protein [Elizabethkingia anophelis]|nr:TIGR02646 family protein [Elizabethkingia anophelis]
MIKIDRSQVQKPPALDKKNKTGKTETDRAIEHYTSPTFDGTTNFKFKIYSNSEVKEALIKLFKRKCAYCESTFLHVYSGDVEHFRPKGEIEEAAPNKKPGYYWLAADWDNLLLSCRNCNQKLSHSIYGTRTKKTMGKMNQFPLSDATQYVRKHNHVNGIADEEPYRLLLNPCIDDPEEHLEYGDEGVIRPKKDTRGVESIKAKTSIDVYVLQRMYLVQSRERKLIEMQAQIQRVKEATENYNDIIGSSDTTKKFYFERILKRELERLKKFLNPEEEYVGMARQFVGEFLKTNFGFTI